MAEFNYFYNSIPQTYRAPNFDTERDAVSVRKLSAYEGLPLISVPNITQSVCSVIRYSGIVA